MMISRRSVCAGIASVSVGGGRVLSQGVIPNPPSPDALEPGDFLWSKPMCSYVPLYKTDGMANTKPEEAWEQEKKEFLDRVAKSGSSSKYPEIHNIERMTFEDFVLKFQGPEALQNLQTQSENARVAGNVSALGIANFFNLYCGHAAIVGKPDEGGVPQVIEAEYKFKVVKITYKQFLKNHDDSDVFHGRLKNYSKDLRAIVADKADKYIETPYDFWNFNLRDKSGVYCSKLPWLCVYDAFTTALDHKALDGWRPFWFTPKMMTESPDIEMLEHRTLVEFTKPGPACTSGGGGIRE